jgi:hypothetical protein
VDPDLALFGGGGRVGLSKAASGSLAGSYVGVGGTEADVVGFDFEGRAETMNCSFNATCRSAVAPFNVTSSLRSI